MVYCYKLHSYLAMHAHVIAIANKLVMYIATCYSYVYSIAITTAVIAITSYICILVTIVVASSFVNLCTEN